ncbi:hypothetical protein BAUCODRAFT_32386 [Baudoinia panamericana UAMH 10762]|uniref:Uncharacterized protein n=1 Tax=Baudoinia panamericana (strain UAMH 10762) TaxID=717646 RepID=M2NGB9_BAUPA|nr:uncharacterized protein BAUCODRAFT_32386 [Baudoinia panamericana UAMH 10762]EMC98354.1 hypothetical protein BAUCODRAFT_32386 [Baudoinia panamericana UAMH 10762]
MLLGGSYHWLLRLSVSVNSEQCDRADILSNTVCASIRYQDRTNEPSFNTDKQTVPGA